MYDNIVILYLKAYAIIVIELNLEVIPRPQSGMPDLTVVGRWTGGSKAVSLYGKMDDAGGGVGC